MWRTLLPFRGDVVHSGPGNSSRVAILEEGMQFDAVQMTLETAQLAATREFHAVELARIFQVPPAVVGILGTSNFATSEAARSVFFATNCLTPWAVALELEFQRSVFLSDRYFLELDLSGLTRGTFAERAQTMVGLSVARWGIRGPWTALPETLF
jgi:HK97 family phage portal protein